MSRLLALAGRVVALGAGSWAAWRLLGPEVPRRYPVPQVAPVCHPGRTVMVGHHEFFVREAGPIDAPTIVLVHGWGLDGAMTFHRVIPRLADRFRVVVPDLRNHGRSDWIRSRFEVAEMADELAGLLRRIGVDRPVVLGYSLGGMVVQELARRHPDLAGHLVLAGTAARPVPARRPLVRTGFWMLRAVARISTTEGARFTGRVLRGDGSLRAEHMRWMFEGLKRRDPSLFYEAGNAAWRFDSRPWISSLGVPVTVVIPTGDTLVPVAAQRELGELIGDADVVELAGCGHESVFTRSADYAELLTRIAGETDRGAHRSPPPAARGRR